MFAPSDPAETLVSIDRAEVQGDRAHLSDDQAATLDRAQVRLMQGDATAAHAVDSVLNKTVRMPVYRWEQAQKEIDKLARKATKKGVAAPKIEEVERQTIGEGDEAETWITARMLGAAPVLNGWRCVATLTPANVGPADAFYTHTATGETLSFEAFESVSMRCDHNITCKRGSTEFTRKCGTRKRALVFVIEHADRGLKCVGSKCLNDYLGSDALTAWFVFSRFHALGAQVDGGDWDRNAHAQWLADHPEFACNGSKTKDVPIPVRDFVACCVAQVREHGYASAGGVGWADATGRVVWLDYQRAEHVAPSEDDYARADEIGDWIAGLDASGGYLANLSHAVRTAETDRGSARVQRFTSTKGVKLSSANLIASAVPSFERELTRRAEVAISESIEQLNEYLPFEDGTPVTARLRVARDVRWALSCFDSSGRTVLLRSHTYADGTPVAVGETITVHGTIGKQSEYQGTCQTFINDAQLHRASEHAVI